MSKKTVFIIIFLFAVTAIMVFFIRSSRREVPIKVEEEEGPAVALVLDDCGYSVRNLEGIKAIGVPLTLAILPNTPYAKEMSYFAEKNGMEAILHMPMEPQNQTLSLEENTLNSDMSPLTIRDIVNIAFQEVPAAKGMSNHMGSRATGKEQLMTVVFDDLKKRGLFFFDSFTGKNSVCKKVAEKLKVPYLRRDIFIDNKPDKEYIFGQMKIMAKQAQSKGKVAVIGHDRKNTVEVLAEIVPKLKEQGIRFVLLSEMVEQSAENR